MADATPGATTPAPVEIVLCPSTALADGGRAHVFELLEWGRPVRGFVQRFQGDLIAYLNRCAHVPAEMDWQEGQFLDDSRQWILCSIHGAAYSPRDGLCIAGPCVGRRLKPLRVAEREGQVYWYPHGELSPVAAV